MDKEETRRQFNICLHKLCKECHGTGRKEDGSICVHYIACPCKDCNPFSYDI